MIYGTDWGAYLGPSNEIQIPFKVLRDAGLCDFFICKGDQDVPHINTMANLQAARAEGVPVVACYYWNFPGNAAQAQIDHYSEMIQKENPDFIAVDIEDETTGKTSLAISENAKFLCAGLKNNFPKKQVIPYTSWNYINGHVPDANTWLGQYDAWVASAIDFGMKPYEQTLGQIRSRPTAQEKPMLPDAWKNSPWKIWQFTTRMRPQGFEFPMAHQYDWDVFNGSLDDLLAWVRKDGGDVRVTTSTDELEKRLAKLEEWAKGQGYVP